MKQLLKAPILRRAAGLALVSVLSFSLVACGDSKEETTGGSSDDVAKTEVVLASTTSTQDSGLFDVLEPEFEKAYAQYDIKIVAVGTGEALELGRMKDADVLLVHAKADEETLVQEGYGVERKDVMYNDFVILGPAADPSGVGGSADTPTAMAAIASGKAEFVSRGDNSGTHKKELKLWDAAGITPESDWYAETGQGMGDTLKIASEKQAYTIADRATYLNMMDTLDIEVVFEGAPELFNQYGVIVVTDAANQDGGQAFFDWVTSQEGQAIIADYGVETFGQALFTPNAP